MQNYAASGDVPALRTAAGQAIPSIQMHLQQAQMLQVALQRRRLRRHPRHRRSARRAGERG